MEILSLHSPHAELQNLIISHAFFQAPAAEDPLKQTGSAESANEYSSSTVRKNDIQSPNLWKVCPFLLREHNSFLYSTAVFSTI